MPELKIVITAENQKALDELKQLQEKLFQLQETVKNYKGDWPLTNTINVKIPELQAKISALQGTLTKAGVEFDNFGNNTQKIALGSNRAGLALNDFSRIVQDAPFGFIAISNNLNPMLESFQRLKTESGSTGGALKSMASSLIGPAGIGVAIGVVSGLAVIFSKQISDFFKKPTDELEKFRNELNKVAEEIYKLIGQEQTKRTKGIFLAELITGSDPTRQQEALKQLKKLYSDNKAIQDAKLGADKAYYTTLVNQAAMQNSAVANEKNNAAQLDKLNEEKLKNDEKRNAKLAELDKGIGLGFFKAGKGAYQNRIDELKVEVNKQYDILGKEIEKDIAKLESNTFKALSKITLIPTPETLKKEAAKPKEKKIKSPVKSISDGVYDQSLETQAREQYSKTPFVSTIPEAANIGNGSLFGMFDEKTNGKINTTKNELTEFLKQTKDGFKQANDAAHQFSENMAGGITNSLQGAFDALMKGENVFQALSQSVLKFAEDVGFAIIKAQILAYIQAGIAVSSGGAGAAAGGTGFLDILMGLLGLGGVKPHAAGGITTGPSMGLIGEAGPEAIMPLSKLSSFLNTSFNAGSMSGGNSSNGGQFVLRGQDLLLAVNRSQKASNIKGQSISLA